MCGIAAVLDPARSRTTEALEAVVVAMADRMVPRGPDASGRWVDASVGVALGHRRLSILDLSEAGAQPMASADGRWVLTYNGEIYDHDELAADLDAAGVVRRGHSDTEVLVEAIARWGVAATLDRVDGMFAFALWDRLERRLTLARDRMGEKPLYYGRLGAGEVVVGSSLDAVRAHPRFDRDIDRAALTLFFRHKYVPAPLSIYEGIRKLAPGHLVEIAADGTIGEPRPYWSLYDGVGGERFAGGAAEAVDELERLLDRSVRRRMVADVAVGAFLSGGIDSSAVVAAAQRTSSRPVQTFTIGSPSADYDESSDARRVADHLGTDHTELMVTDAEARAAVPRLGGVYDEPFADSSQLPTLLVSELARRSVTVALSGDGGDELFLGYNRYVWVPAIWGRVGRLPVGARRGGAAAARRVRPGWWDRAAGVLPRSRRPRQLGLKVAKVLLVADAPSPEEMFHRLTSHWQAPADLVRGGREVPTVHTDPSRWPPTTSIVEHMAAVDAITYLPDDVLVKLDRATMAVSLEGRVPLLDRSIVEFATSLPAELRLRDGVTKWPLRQVLERSVPATLWDRPKSGFGIPIETWLRGPLRGWAQDLLSGPAVREHLDPALVERTWSEHLSGRADRSYELWDVLMFAQWHAERHGS